MTFILTLTFLLAVFAGLVIIVRALGGSSGSADRSATRRRAVCPSCREENPGGARFCGRCGARIDKRH